MIARTAKPKGARVFPGSTVYVVEYHPMGKQRIDPITREIDYEPDPQWELCGIFASKKAANAHCDTRGETDPAFRAGRYSGSVYVLPKIVA